MKPANALSLIALGAILAFAVHAHMHFVDWNAAGWVIMLTGTAGLFLPRAARRWIRQRLILRGAFGPALEVNGRRYSRRLMPGGLLQAGGLDAEVQGSAVEEVIQE
jgi:uncharacterized membrane protein